MLAVQESMGIVYPIHFSFGDIEERRERRKHSKDVINSDELFRLFV